MQKAFSRTLLGVIGLLIFPWSLLDFCVTHPLGHQHQHEHGEPGPCQLRTIYKGFWSPMECYHFVVEADDFQIPKNNYNWPAISGLNSPVSCLIKDTPPPEKIFISFPDPLSTSDPPDPGNPLRGPPILL